MENHELALQAAREAVDQLPSNHPNRPAALNKLATRFGQAFLATGSQHYLEELVQVSREALTVSVQVGDRITALHNLGNGLGNKFQKTGARSDLEQSIRVAYEALNLAGSNHPRRPSLIYNICNGLGERYLMFRAATDLEEAIRLEREAIDLTLETHRHRLSLQCSLATSLLHNYWRTKDIAFIIEAIQTLQNSLDIAPTDHHERPRLLELLGITLYEKYKKTRDPIDLEKSTVATRQAIDIAPEKHPDLINRFDSLGNRLEDSYIRTGNTVYLEEAIEIARRVVETTPEGLPNRAYYLNNLGLRLGKRYWYDSQDTLDLEEAKSYYQTSLYQSNAPIMARIKAARQLLHVTKDWQKAWEISSFAVQLIPNVMVRSLENSDKQQISSEITGLASDAATAALYARKGALLALKQLEQGRNLLANSIQEMRTDVQELEEHYPQLAERFKRLRGELDLPGLRETSSAAQIYTDTPTFGGHKRYDISKELDHLLIEIRRQDGFKNFLLPPTTAEIREATKEGPIVVINVSSASCDALLVQPHRIRAVNLPDLNIQDIKTHTKAGRLGSSTVLEWLWDAVADPVLSELEYDDPCSPDDENLPHVWWIPIGPLSRFPLHAAGYHTDGSRNTVLDRVMSSYSSSIRAIIQGRQRPVAPLEPFERAFIVAMERTPGYQDLPFAAEEVEALRSLCESVFIDPMDLGRRKEEVIAMLAMSRCRLFHFAGHGLTDESDPTKSSLVLEDWKDDPLTVADFLEVDLHQNPPSLAYLSACGTSQINSDKLVDEAIHLVSAFQLAGFRHVIGTLWEVNDKICVTVARSIYTGIIESAMDDQSICRALHKALLLLRQMWLEEIQKMNHQTTELKTGRVPIKDNGSRSVTRDVVLYDDDEGQEKEDSSQVSPNWVPYIHYGV